MVNDYQKPQTKVHSVSDYSSSYNLPLTLWTQFSFNYYSIPVEKLEPTILLVSSDNEEEIDEIVQ